VERLFGARRLIPRAAALLVVYLATFAVFGGLIWLTLPPLLDQIGALVTAAPSYAAHAQSVYAAATEWYRQLPLPPDVRDGIDERLADVPALLIVTGQNLGVGLFRTTTRTLGFVFGFLIVPVWMFYALRDSDQLGPILVSLFPAPWRQTVRELAGIADTILGTFLRGQLVLMFAVGLAVLLGAALLGMTVSPTLGRYSLLLGVIAGITEAIPLVGPIVGAVPGVLLALLDGPSALLWTVAMYIAVQQLENNLLVPKIVGDALDLKPAIIIVALAVGSDLFGIPGAILAAPLLVLAREWTRYLYSRMSPP
jgi:predicted PurR-regulated permease PerM